MACEVSLINKNITKIAMLLINNVTASHQHICTAFVERNESVSRLCTTNGTTLPLANREAQISQCKYLQNYLSESERVSEGFSLYFAGYESAVAVQLRSVQ